MSKVTLFFEKKVFKNKVHRCSTPLINTSEWIITCKQTFLHFLNGPYFPARKWVGILFKYLPTNFVFGPKMSNNNRSRTEIAHVAVRKRHQRQNEIIIFFTRAILESAKLIFFQYFITYKRISYKRMLCERRAFIAKA